MMAVAFKRWCFPAHIDRQRSLSFACIVALLVIACAVAPARADPKPVLPFLLPVFCTLVALMGIATASLLLIQARIDANLPLAILAAAYAFTVPLAIGSALALPQSVMVRGSGDSGLQTAAYGLAIWRIGFPLGLFGFALARGGAANERRMVMPAWLPAALAFALGAIATGIAFGLSDRLPQMFVLGQPTRVDGVLSAASMLMCLAAVIALFQIHRPKSIDYWTAVAAAAATLDALGASLMSDRYSLGWYASYGFGTVAATALLCTVATRASHVARALHGRLSAEEELRKLAETIPQIVWTALPTGVVDWANRRWFDYTGSSDGPHASRWQDAVHPGDLAQFKRRVPDIVARALDFEVDMRLRRRDGAFRWFLIRVVPMRDESGRVIRWYGTSTDVDEERQQDAGLRELYAREHRIAASLQKAFLPARFPRFTGLAFSHVFLPAATGINVGGDLYDVFHVGERRIAVCMGDVKGHGLEAAVRMLRVRELVRAAAFDDPAPSVVLQRAAHSLSTDEAEHAVTALYGVFDTELRTFTYASAGHPSPALLRDGAARTLASGGPSFGVAHPPCFEDHAVRLDEGDVIVLYTDGLLETSDPAAGEGRLLEVLGRGVVDASSLARELVPALQLDDAAVATIAVGSMAPECTPRDWHFHAPQAAAARWARASFTLYFSACGASDGEIIDAEHAFGELLANVVRYAPGPVDIELEWRDMTPYLSVSDRGPDRLTSAARNPSPKDAESGRGLLILRGLGLRPISSAREGGGTRVVVALSCRSFDRARSIAMASP